MWDFLKKAAGAVVDAGASYLVQASAVERIINAPDFDTGKAWLRSHVFEIEEKAQFDMLLSVIGNRYKQAKDQAAEQGMDSWGSSYEDQMAYRMAHVGTGTPMRDAEAERMMQIFEAMDHFARIFWQEASATRVPSAEPTALPRAPVSDPEAWKETPGAEETRTAFARHMERIEEVFPSEPRQQELKEGPLSEIDGMFLRLDADKRLMSAMMRTMPGQVAPEVVSELAAIGQLYRDILDRAPTDSDLLKREDVLYSLGQSFEFCGNAQESMGDPEAALLSFQKARTTYAEANRLDVLEKLDRKILLAQADIDEDDSAVLARLEHPKTDPMEEAERLMELASYAGRREPKTALTHLRQAEKVLADAGIMPNSGEELATTMIQTFGEGGDMTGGLESLQQQTVARMRYVGLYKQIEKVLGFTEQGTPDYEADQALAAEYRAKWQAIESQDENKDFSEIMLGALKSGAIKLK